MLWHVCWWTLSSKCFKLARQTRPSFTLPIYCTEEFENVHCFLSCARARIAVTWSSNCAHAQWRKAERGVHMSSSESEQRVTWSDHYVMHAIASEIWLCPRVRTSHEFTWWVGLLARSCQIEDCGRNQTRLRRVLWSSLTWQPAFHRTMSQGTTVIPVSSKSFSFWDFHSLYSGYLA